MRYRRPSTALELSRREHPLQDLRARELATRACPALGPARAQPLRNLAARPVWEVAMLGLAAPRPAQFAAQSSALMRRASQARGWPGEPTIGRGATSRPPLSKHDV